MKTKFYIFFLLHCIFLHNNIIKAEETSDAKRDQTVLQAFLLENIVIEAEEISDEKLEQIVLKEITEALESEPESGALFLASAFDTSVLTSNVSNVAAMSFVGPIIRVIFNLVQKYGQRVLVIIKNNWTAIRAGQKRIDYKCWNECVQRLTKTDQILFPDAVKICAPLCVK